MTTKWIAILALLGAAPAAGQKATETPDFRGMSDAELREQVGAVGTEGFREPCQIKVPLFAELLRRYPDNPGSIAGSLTAQAFCAYEEERDEEALALLKRAESAFPSGPAFTGLGLHLATQLEDGVEALARLRTIAEFHHLDSLPAESVFAGMRTVRADGLSDELDEFAYELSASTDFRSLNPDLQGSLATNAIRHAVKIADFSRVDDLLRYDANPDNYLTMLADRRYEAAWPQIEERAGDNLRKVVETYVGQSAEYLAEKPEDRDRLSTYAHALLFAGRYQEAVDVARNWRPERDSLEGLEEGDGWALNIEAYALDALGRRDEADTVFDQLAALPTDEFPWVVNFVINRASRLIGQERWEDGLAATALARSVAEKHGTTYAKMIIARDRACALHHLERLDDVASETEFLVENFDVHPPIATTGLLCAGMRDRARLMLAQSLSKRVPRAVVMEAMQDSRFDMFYTPSSLPEMRELILTDEDLREEVLKDVRILPDRFVPMSYIRRAEIRRAVP